MTKNMRIGFAYVFVALAVLAFERDVPSVGALALAAFALVHVIRGGNDDETI